VRQPRLEIKKDAKGMVVVPGAVMVEVTSARELLATFEKVCFPAWPVLTNNHDTASIQEKNEDSALQMRVGDAGLAAQS